MAQSINSVNGLVPIGSAQQEDVRRTLLGVREKLLSGISANPPPEAIMAQNDIGDIIDQAG